MATYWIPTGYSAASHAEAAKTVLKPVVIDWTTDNREAWNSVHRTFSRAMDVALQSIGIGYAENFIKRDW